MSKIRKIYWAYRNKITNKLFGIVHVPAQKIPGRAGGRKKGDVLISYFTEPFTLAPWEPFSNFHTMYWECFEIARLFSERGYACDITNANGNPKTKNFIPRKAYRVCIDTENNLERWKPYLPADCKTVFHILITHWEHYNQAEKERLAALKKRRGFELATRRQVPSSRDAELADYLEGFGNKTVFGTFKQFGKPITFIPISTVVTYDFPEKKNFDEAKKHFLWIGGGGAVLKGLDLTLEAFAKMPDLQLHVCGPYAGEKDFAEAYKKELNDTPNIHAYGRIDVAGEEFRKVLDTCGAVIYPSGAEGSSGSIVQAMHAGLVPIISNETGIREDSGYIPLRQPSVASVIEAAREFSSLPASAVKERSLSIWNFARQQYTRDTFSKGYTKFIDNVIKL